MIATDRPRFHLCARCVRDRGLEASEAFVRVALDVRVTGACDDCKCIVEDPDELEAWRPLNVPDPAPTLPMLPKR